MVGSTFIADSATGIDRWINEGAQKLHQILVETYSSDYMETTATVPPSAAGLAALPSDFFKLLGVEMTVGGQAYTLHRYNRQERNAFGVVSPRRSLPLYKLTGPSSSTYYRQIEFKPPALAYGQTLTVRYAPVFSARNQMGVITNAVLTATTDTVDFDNGWERYIVLYTAIQMLKKEESDTGPLEMELAECFKQIVAGAENRDADQAPQAVDADAVDWDPLRYI